MKIVRRGYLSEYEILFKEKGLEKLKEASKDCLYLLNRGYKVEPFVIWQILEEVIILLIKPKELFS